MGADQGAGTSVPVRGEKEGNERGYRKGGWDEPPEREGGGRWAPTRARANVCAYVCFAGGERRGGIEWRKGREVKERG